MVVIAMTSYTTYFPVLVMCYCLPDSTLPAAVGMQQCTLHVCHRSIHHCFFMTYLDCKGLVWVTCGQGQKISAAHINTIEKQMI